MLILGYDRHPEGRRLVVNEAEAERVRAIFDLYLREGSLVAAAQELNRRGWTTKSWVTRKGREVPPRAFGSSNLRALLTNPAYAGSKSVRARRRSSGSTSAPPAWARAASSVRAWRSGSAPIPRIWSTTTFSISRAGTDFVGQAAQPSSRVFAQT